MFIRIAVTPIVSVNLTFYESFVCNSSANSALMYTGAMGSGLQTPNITCNGLVYINSTLTVTEVMVGLNGAPVPLNVTETQSYYTYVNGTRD
jgi:hypothetical protein